MDSQVEPKVTPVFQRIRLLEALIIILIGGARSSKSQSVCQDLIDKFFTEENKSFLITRKANPYVKLITMEMFIRLLIEYGLYDLVVHNKSDQTIRYKNNLLIYSGMDKPEKFKSSEFNYIWLEEGTEFTYHDFRLLKLRLSGKTKPGEKNRMYITTNPSEENHFIQKIEDGRIKERDVAFDYSTYMDNIFLDDFYVQELEDLREQDPVYWKIYGLGEWASFGNVIYNPYKMLAFDKYPERYEMEFYGLDFGYNNPTALLWHGIWEKKIYMKELLYKTHLTDAEVVEELKKLIPEDKRRNVIYADSAHPEKIEAINRAGFFCKSSDKAVQSGIMFVKSLPLYSCAENVYLNKERSGYKWIEDKDGNPTDKPLEYNDHLMAAKRYALYTHLRNIWYSPKSVKGQLVKREGFVDQLENF